MNLNELKTLLPLGARIQLNWSKSKGYVFVAPSIFEGEYEVVRPTTWPYNCDVILSYAWAVHMAQLQEEAFASISGTPLMKYSFALSRLMAEMEQLVLLATSFVKAHEGLSQKEYAGEVMNNDHFAMIMGVKRSIKKLLFDARKRSPREAVNAFYDANASGYFYP